VLLNMIRSWGGKGACPALWAAHMLPMWQIAGGR
jgi:hypothetical protein